MNGFIFKKIGHVVTYTHQILYSLAKFKINVE